MAKKTINNVDDIKKVYEDESLLREMYNDDVERVKNGEKAIFFGHLNDKPLENVYPEYEILGPSYLKLLRGLKAPSVYKVDPSSLGITGGDIADGAFDVARGILNLPRTIGDIFIRTGKGVGNILGDGPASKIWKASIGKWMTYFGRYPERMPAFIDASKGMNGEDDMISFSDAFSDADKKGLDEFEWKGKKYKVEKKKEGGETKPSRRRIDWDKFKEAYGNMKRKGAGHARKIDTEGLNYLYDALYRNNFTKGQIEAIIGNVIEESGGDPFAKAKGSQYKGLFQESNIRYPISEFEADKKRFDGKKKEYIDYMVDRFNKHVRDAKYYSVKGTKYKKAQEAVDEFFSTEAGIDYSYPLVYAFEAPGDKEGTYRNRKSVSDIISKSYADDGLYEPDVTANEVEPKQDANNNGFGAAFKEAKRKGLNEFIFNGKKYSTEVKEDGGDVSEDDERAMFREMYRSDIERVKNGERAIFFGELNDKPLKDSHPEILFFPTLNVVDGVLEGLDDVDKGEYANAVLSGLLGFTPLLAKKALSYLRREKKIRDALGDFNETIERFGNDRINGDTYSPSNTKYRLSLKHNKDVLSKEGAIGTDRLLHQRPERVNPNGTMGVRYGNNKYPVDKLKEMMSDDNNSGNLVKVWWSEGTPRTYSGGKNTIVSIKKDLDKMDMNSQKYLLDNVHVSNSLDLTDDALDAKVYRSYYDDLFVPESHRRGPVVYEDGGGIKQKQKKAYDYFTIKRGMSQIQALAILGNLMAESGLKDDISGDNGTSYGIQQWHNERKDALFKKARKNGHNTPTFEDQLEFLADEYEGKTGYSNFLYARKGKMGPGYYNYSRSDFQDAENLRDAVVAWNQGAGRPHKSVIRNDDRYSAALKVAKNLGFDFGLDAGAAPMYGQMGAGEDFIFHEEGEEPTGDAQPVSGAQAVSTQDTAPTTQEDMMKNWIESYGKDIVAQLMATIGNNKVNMSVDDTTERYRDYMKESKDDEDSKRMALLQAFLPNIQLKIKGVTQVRGDQ